MHCTILTSDTRPFKMLFRWLCCGNILLLLALVVLAILPVVLIVVLLVVICGGIRAFPIGDGYPPVRAAPYLNIEM